MSRFRLLMSAPAKPTPPPPPPPAYWLDVNRTDGLADSDRVALEVFYNEGLCSSLEYMTEEEASAVVTLPTFYNKAIVDWDWSKLTGLNMSSFRDIFFNCSILKFNTLPNGVFDKATDFYRLFSQCKELSLTQLPNDFGKNSINNYYIFNSCNKLALTQLPNDFGNKCTGNGLAGAFFACQKITLESLPNGFGRNVSDYYATFEGCTSLTKIKLNSDFDLTATNYNQTFRNCSQLEEVDLNGCTFSKAKSLYLTFEGTKVKKFIGVFDLSGINADTAFGTGLYHSFPTTTQEIRFAPNTLKFSTWALKYRANNQLTNIDNESLFSLAVCLHDWWDESAGDFVGNEGKEWGVTQLQRNALDANDYESGYSYSDYVADKGWTITIQ